MGGEASAPAQRGAAAGGPLISARFSSCCLLRPRPPSCRPALPPPAASPPSPPPAPLASPRGPVLVLVLRGWSAAKAVCARGTPAAGAATWRASCCQLLLRLFPRPPTAAPAASGPLIANRVWCRRLSASGFCWPLPAGPTPGLLRARGPSIRRLGLVVVVGWSGPPSGWPGAFRLPGSRWSPLGPPLAPPGLVVFVGLVPGRSPAVSAVGASGVTAATAGTGDAGPPRYTRRLRRRRSARASRRLTS